MSPTRDDLETEGKLECTTEDNERNVDERERKKHARKIKIWREKTTGNWKKSAKNVIANVTGSHEEAG